MKPVYRGWIAAPEAAREEITALGIEVGSYDATEGEFTGCVATDKALKRLDERWGEWLWGLAPDGPATAS